jgi:hypothetical protein
MTNDEERPDVLKAWRDGRPREEPARRERGLDTALVDWDWGSVIETRIATAIKKEHKLITDIMAELNAAVITEIKDLIDRQINAAKLEMMSKMVDTLASLGRAVPEAEKKQFQFAREKQQGTTAGEGTEIPNFLTSRGMN